MTIPSMSPAAWARAVADLSARARQGSRRPGSRLGGVREADLGSDQGINVGEGRSLMWTCTSYFQSAYGIVCAGSFGSTRAVVALLRVYRDDSNHAGELYLWPDRVM